MAFLNPILLLGLGAVSIPIIIHLLNRRKFQKVAWAAMRFLKISVEKNQRRMRVEDMILLALRCLLLALLALALARPAILSNATDVLGQSKVTGVIILDNSYSMGMSDGTTTRFDKARQAASAVLDSMPGGSAVAVLLASDIVQGLIPEPTFDLNLARKVVREAPLSDRGTELFPAIASAIDSLKSRLAIRREIYLITDGQAAGWRQLPEIHAALQKSRTEIQTHVILVSEHEDKNLGVSELRMASGVPALNQPLRFEVRVNNYGTSPARDTRVSLSVDGEPACDEFTIPELGPGTGRTLSLFARLASKGFHAVTARIPEDRLAADDRRTVAVRAIKDVQVLLIDGKPGAEVRESSTFFLANALVPVPAEISSDYFVRCAVLPATEFGSARLDNFDAVMLADVPEFPESSVQALGQYLARGGGLVVFPGAKVNATFYNEQLFRRMQFLPAGLGSGHGDAAQDQNFAQLQSRDYRHPLVSIWNDPGSGTLNSARFYRWLKLEPAAVEAQTPTNGPAKGPGQTQSAGQPDVVLRYADGTPAVMERNWGLGRVVLFSSTADTSWNDWPVRPSFVPMLHRVLGRIVQRQDEGLNIRTGEKFMRRVSTDFLDRDAAFLRPGQPGGLRDLRRVEAINGGPTLQYELTDWAGLYDVAIAEPPLSLKFAAQPDPAESNIEELAPAQLNLLSAVAGVIPWSPGTSVKSIMDRQRSGLEFWLPIALAAMLIALVETFLGQWFSRSK